MIAQYHSLRSEVSLLLSNGHLAARLYPVGMVWGEAAIVRKRVNHHLATEAILMQAVVGSALNPKEGGKAFQKMIKEMTSG